MSFGPNFSVPKSNSVDNFASLDSRPPWGPWGRQSSGVICFVTVAPPWRIFSLLWKYWPMLEVWSWKKVFLSVSIATISTFPQKCTLWRYDYETSQPKIGQCASGSQHSPKKRPKNAIKPNETPNPLGFTSFRIRSWRLKKNYSLFFSFIGTHKVICI